MNPPTPAPQFLWDFITGGAPVNEYSIMGFNMIIIADTILLFLIAYLTYVSYRIYSIYCSKEEDQQ